MAPLRTRPASQGFVLLIVLWTIALLALIGAHFTGAARQRVATAQLLRANARLEAAADGAVFQTILDLLRTQGIAAAGHRTASIGGIGVQIALRDEAEKVNPNTASPEILQNVLGQAGLAPPEAAKLARVIVDWRTRSPVSVQGQTKAALYQAAGRPYIPTNQPFTNLDEIGFVIGVTPDILTAIRPLLSVQREESRALPQGMAAVNQADNEPGGVAHASPIVTGNHVWQIDAIAGLADGLTAHRRALVRIKPEPDAGTPPFEILDWGNDR